MIPGRVYEGGFVVNASAKAPWPKACEGCALKPHDPQQLGADGQADVRALIEADQLVFYCLHRCDENNQHRICASGAAIAKGAARDPKPRQARIP